MKPDRIHYLQLILYKVRADLKVEAAQGYLGVLWWVLEPVLYMGAFYIIFAVAMQRGGENFVPWLLSGLVVWKWFNTSVRRSATSIRKGRGLMAQVYLPKVFFPAVAILGNGARFLFTLLLLMVFLLVYGIEPTWNWLLIPLMVLLQLLLITGVSLLTAALVPLWPDLMLVVGNGLMMMFFLSGIFFDLSAVGGWLGILLKLNPMVPVIDAWRSILLGLPWQNLPWLGWTLLVALLTLVPGIRLLHRYDRYYARLA